MRYTSTDIGEGTAVEMTWGEYRQSLPEEDRAACRIDPFNRSDAELAVEMMTTGNSNNLTQGYFITPLGDNIYFDPTPRWMDKVSFSRVCKIVEDQVSA